MSKLRKSAGGDQQAQDRTRMKFRLRYSAGDDEPFRVYAVWTGERPWVMPLSYPVARLYDDGAVLPVPWTEERLRDALIGTMHMIRQTYGGEWILEITENKPDADVEIRRRWVPKPVFKTVPAVPPIRKVAPREMIDRLRQPVGATGHPLRAGPDFFEQEDAEQKLIEAETAREAGEGE